MKKLLSIIVLVLAGSANAQKQGGGATLYNTATPCTNGCYGFNGRNEHVGTGEDLSNGFGNYGVVGVTAPTGGATGIGAGVFGLAAFNDINIGVLSRANIYKAGATHIGAALFALNDSSGIPSGKTVGLYVSLSALPTSKATLNAQLEPAGLIVDTKATGSPGVIVRHAGIKVFEVPSDAPLRVYQGGLTQPTCDAAHRGTFFLTESGAGVADRLEVCGKDSADAYVWKPAAIF